MADAAVQRESSCHFAARVGQSCVCVCTDARAIASRGTEHHAGDVMGVGVRWGRGRSVGGGLCCLSQLSRQVQGGGVFLRLQSQVGDACVLARRAEAGLRQRQVQVERVVRRGGGGGGGGGRVVEEQRRQRGGGQAGRTADGGECGGGRQCSGGGTLEGRGGRRPCARRPATAAVQVVHVEAIEGETHRRHVDVGSDSTRVQRARGRVHDDTCADNTDRLYVQWYPRYKITSTITKQG